MELIPEPGLRAAIVLRELYAGLPAERTARAYVLVTEEAERKANAVISGWLNEAYNQGLEDAHTTALKAEEADTRDFLAQARTVTRVVEMGTAREEAQEKLNKGGGSEYPGGPVPVW